MTIEWWQGGEVTGVDCAFALGAVNLGGLEMRLGLGDGVTRGSNGRWLQAQMQCSGWCVLGIPYKSIILAGHHGYTARLG